MASSAADPSSLPNRGAPLRDQLLAQVKRALQIHQHSNAVFLADKLVTLSPDCETLLLFGEALFAAHQYKRCHHLLTQRSTLSKITKSDLQCLHLAAKCMEETLDWVECFNVLGGPEDEQFEELLTGFSRSPIALQCPNYQHLIASLCLMRAKSHDMLDAKSRAVQYYRRTLQIDPFQTEAFERLIDNHFLTSAQEVELLDSLELGSDGAWLRLIYQAKIDKSSGGNGLESALQTLHNQYGMKSSLDLMCSMAESHYHAQQFNQAYNVTKSIIEIDPFHLVCLPIHLCCLVELGKKSELFYMAHKLVDAYPTGVPVPWFAVGCYYFAVKKWGQARKFFLKATSIDNRFLPAWIGVGHSYANADETDQAMTAYRAAFRLFPGCHAPPLYMGMLHSKVDTANLPLAEQFIRQAMQICTVSIPPARAEIAALGTTTTPGSVVTVARDPLVHNELGAICFKSHMYDKALKYFQFAVNLCGNDESSHMWQTAVINIAHTYRKLRLYDLAIANFEKALSLNPHDASVYSALGFTYHLKGDLHRAIDWYHKALGIRSDSTFIAEMLAKALQEVFESHFPGDEIAAVDGAEEGDDEQLERQVDMQEQDDIIEAEFDDVGDAELAYDAT